MLLDTIAYPQDIPVFFRMLDMPLFSHVGVRMVPPAVQTRIALRIAYLDNSKIDDEEVETYAAPLRTAAGKHAIIHSARQIMPEGLDEISERYKSIEMPTLIVWCDHDRIVPLDVGLEAAAHAAQLHPQIGRGLRTHAARGAAGGDARSDPGFSRRLAGRPGLSRIRPCP